MPALSLSIDGPPLLLRQSSELRRRAAAFRGMARAACADAMVLQARAGLLRDRARLVCVAVAGDVGSARRESDRLVRRAGSRQAASSERADDVRRRTFRDDDDVTWRVREVDTRGVPGARAARCLLFETDSVVRRCWHVPADWSTLPVTALCELCLGPPDGSPRRRA